jgi:hypothetical protein
LVETAKTVRRGGRWIVLGVGPAKRHVWSKRTVRLMPFRMSAGAKHVNVNPLRYFLRTPTLDSKAETFLQRGMALAMGWATQGLVVPHVSQTIDSTVEAVNAGLQSLKAGHGTLGKVAVIVDRDVAPENVLGGRLSSHGARTSSS